MDYVVAGAARTHEHLLDPAFAGALSSAERLLRSVLEPLARAVDEHGQASGAWAPLRTALRAYGWAPQPSRARSAPRLPSLLTKRGGDAGRAAETTRSM